MPPIPNLQHLLNCNPINSTACPAGQSVPQIATRSFTGLGDLLSGLLNIIFSIAVFLAFFWLVWGAFQYMSAGGDKQKLADARARITWAIVGLLLILIAFLVAQFTAEVLPPKGGVPI